MTGTESHRARGVRLLVNVLGLPLLYVLSSGPVLGLAFRLRESTHWDGFYAAMWLYAPLLLWGPDTPLMRYIEWWVGTVFDTVGPG